MSTIKNIDALSLSREQIEQIEAGARLYRKHANIRIEVKEYKPDKLLLKVWVRQGATNNKHYLSADQLRDRAIDLFRQVFDEEIKIIAQAKEHDPGPLDVVTKDWVGKQMGRLGIKQVDAAHDLGLTPANLSSMIVGDRALSNSARAMFYYYFLHKGMAQINKEEYL